MSKSDWLLLGLAAAMFVLVAFILGRYAFPKADPDELDEAYDDGRADQRRYDLAEIARLEHDVAWLESQGSHDALHPTYEVLSPAALDAANDSPDRPESDPLLALQTGRPGGLHWEQVRAGITPLQLDVMAGWDHAKRQAERLAAWEIACRASWDAVAA